MEPLRCCFIGVHVLHGDALLNATGQHRRIDALVLGTLLLHVVIDRGRICDVQRRHMAQRMLPSGQGSDMDITGQDRGTSCQTGVRHGQANAGTGACNQHHPL